MHFPESAHAVSLRTSPTRRWVVTLVSLLAFVLAPQIGHANPVVEPVAADPTVIRDDDGAFYMFTTADDWGNGRGMHAMSMFTSFDLVDWMYVGDVFDELPA